ncbi:MAG: sirohydrochlorin chelatase [Nostocoides sp.]
MSPHHGACDDGPPALVICAHGTRDPGGRTVVVDAIEAVAARLPGVTVHAAYADVHRPRIGEVIAGLPRPVRPPCGQRPSTVIVPLLISAGFHVRTDISDAVSDRPDVHVTAPLSPDDRLLDIIDDRLSARKVPFGATVLLAPAGSSDPSALANYEHAAQHLAERRGGVVTMAYATGDLGQAVRRARADGADHVAVASFLLAPGRIHGKLAACGADTITDALLPDARIIDIVLDRYHAALA